MTDSHYFASNAIGWATAESRDEVIEKLALRNDAPGGTRKWLSNTHKSGKPGIYFWSCKVHTPADASYRIESFAPKGVKVSEPKEHYLTYLTSKKAAFWTPKEAA